MSEAEWRAAAGAQDPTGREQPWTLLDLVGALVEVGASEREVVAAVLDLLASGRVRLVGEFCEAHLPAAARPPTGPERLAPSRV